MQQSSMVQVWPIPSEHHRLARPVAAPLDLRNPTHIRAECHPIDPEPGSSLNSQLWAATILPSLSTMRPQPEKPLPRRQPWCEENSVLVLSNCNWMTSQAYK